MTTIEEFYYGSRYERRALRWIPPSVDPDTRKPVLVYFPGGGWSRSHPLAFFGDATQRPAIPPEPLWPLIEGVEQSLPIAVFSAWYGMANYDYSEAQLGGTNDPATAQLAGMFGYDVWPTTSRYLDSGVADGKALIQHIKDCADEYHVDPDNIIVMGQSAGGQVAGVVAYDYSAPFWSDFTSVVSRQHAPRNSSRVKGVHLVKTPDDWRNYREFDLHGHLFGVHDEAAWDGLRSERKASLSPLGVLASTKLGVPSYLYYPRVGRTAVRGVDVPPFEAPPWTGSPYHAALNGNQILLELTRQDVPSVIFEHDGNAPLGAYPSGAWLWMQGVWSAQV